MVECLVVTLKVVSSNLGTDKSFSIIENKVTESMKTVAHSGEQIMSLKSYSLTFWPMFFNLTLAYGTLKQSCCVRTIDHGPTKASRDTIKCQKLVRKMSLLSQFCVRTAFYYSNMNFFFRTIAASLSK